MSSIRKDFLLELIRQFNPALANTDVQDVASAMKISLAEAERVAKDLEAEGYISVVGLGGNVAPTGTGRQIAIDANWE